MHDRTSSCPGRLGGKGSLVCGFWGCCGGGPQTWLAFDRAINCCRCVLHVGGQQSVNACVCGASVSNNNACVG